MIYRILFLICFFTVIEQLDAQPYKTTFASLAQNIDYDDPYYVDPYPGFCWASLPIDRVGDTTVTSADWTYMRPCQIDTINPHPVDPNVPRAVVGEAHMINTPSGRPWFVTGGAHTWDSLGRRVTRSSLCPRAGSIGGYDEASPLPFQISLILPVRDTPGVYRHLVFGYSSGVRYRYTDKYSAFNRIYNYRLDARFDSQVVDPSNGVSGNGSHLRYTPEPIDTLVIEQAVDYDSGLNAYSLDSSVRPSQGTFSRMLAVAHGNGIDWWVICIGGQYHPTAVAIFLLDENGLKLEHSYPTALPFEYGYQHALLDGFQSAVNFQGTQLAVHALPSEGLQPVRTSSNFDPEQLGIALWDFDRCSGALSNRQHIIPDYQPTGASPFFPRDVIRAGNGVGFSPSGKYLYYNEASYIARYDLTHSDIPSTNQIVYAPDTLGGICSEIFGTTGVSSLGRFTTLPNGSLVFAPGNSCQNQLILRNIDAVDPTEITGGVGEFVTPCHNNSAFLYTNLEMYDLEGSACDTNGVDGWNPTCSIVEPAPDTFYICEAGVSYAWKNQVLDTTGNFVYRKQDPEGCDSIWRAVVVQNEPIRIPIWIAGTAGDTISGVIINGDTTFVMTFLSTRSGCDSIVTYTVSTTSATSSPVLVEALQVYPNPTSRHNDLNVILPDQEGKLELYDVHGRKIKEISISSEGLHQLSTIDLSSGQYILTFRSREKLWRARLVIR